MPATSAGPGIERWARRPLSASTQVLHRDNHEQQYQYRRDERDTDPIPGIAQYVEDRPSHVATSILVTRGAS